MPHTFARNLVTLLIPISALLLAMAPAAAAGSAESADSATVEEARQFVEEAEARLLDLWIKKDRAEWVQNNFITYDTEFMAAEAKKAVMAATAELAAAATRFDRLELPEDLARKLKLLKLSLSVPAPRDSAAQAELAEIAVSMRSAYGKGRYCPQGKQGECLDLNAMGRILATSRNPDELLDLWEGWRTVSPPLRPRYQRFVELANQGARDLGFDDLGALWRSNYDMSPQDFSAELERLWEQLRPLYEALHAHVRASLAEKYGKDLVPEEGLILAHLLGNMWSQTWSNIYPLVAPPEGDPGFDLTELLKAKQVDAREMVEYGERFFTSLGLDPMPATFWERSLFTKPADREVVCHASAWDVDYDEDLRIKMCIEINDEDFSTVHHELGHNFYQRGPTATWRRSTATAPTTASTRPWATRWLFLLHRNTWPKLACWRACPRTAATWGC
jgi:peptidyl-dipeptidase A